MADRNSQAKATVGTARSRYFADRMKHSAPVTPMRPEQTRSAATSYQRRAGCKWDHESSQNGEIMKNTAARNFTLERGGR